MVLLAGCTQAPAPDDFSTARGQAGINGPFGDSCDRVPGVHVAPPTLTQVFGKTVLVSASRCIYDYEVVPGDGVWIDRTEQHATTGLQALAAALVLPSEPSIGPPCLNLFPIVPVITVTDSAGNVFQPLIPHTSCDYPLDAAAQAIMAVPWKDISTTRVSQLDSEADTIALCGSTWPASLAQAAGNVVAKIVAPDTAPPGLLVCRYVLDRSTANANGEDYLSGKLASAHTIGAVASHTFMSDVAAAPPAGACDAAQAPFDVVSPPIYGTGSYVIVERGGCYRALLDGETVLRQLNSKIVATLGG